MSDAAPTIAAMLTDARAAALDPKPTIDEMIEATAGEANGIETRQFAMLATGDRVMPDPQKIRRAVVLEATARLLGLIKENQPAIARILRDKAGASR